MWIILLGFSVVLVTSMINQPVNAERSFYFEKVIDINKKSFEDSLINPNNLQKIFPENVKLVESKTNENEKTIVKMELGFAGFVINSEVELTNFPGSIHTISTRDLSNEYNIASSGASPIRERYQDVCKIISISTMVPSFGMPS